MPFSPQPRKKGPVTVPQDARKPSCGHSSSQKNCPACIAATAKFPATKNNVIDLPTEKKKAHVLINKVLDTLTKDKRGTEKAALVLASWVNQKRK